MILIVTSQGEIWTTSFFPRQSEMVDEKEKAEKIIPKKKIGKDGKKARKHNRSKVDSNTFKRPENGKGILIRIFNEAVTYDGIHEEDIISKKESENRILWLAIVFQILIAIFTTSLTIVFIGTQNQSNIVILQNITEPLGLKGFAIQHVALIFQDGSIYDISLNENVSNSKQYVMKLPADDFYFGFSNPSEGLQLISSSLSRTITKYNSILGHKTIVSSLPKKWFQSCDKRYQVDCKDLMFSEGIQVGKMFWLWSKKIKG